MWRGRPAFLSQPQTMSPLQAESGYCGPERERRKLDLIHKLILILSVNQMKKWVRSHVCCLLLVLLILCRPGSPPGRCWKEIAGPRLGRCGRPRLDVYPRAAGFRHSTKILTFVNCESHSSHVTALSSSWNLTMNRSSYPTDEESESSFAKQLHSISMSYRPTPASVIQPLLPEPFMFLTRETNLQTK